MILQLIVKYGEASRKEIDDLLMDKLSEILTHDEKKKRIENLLQDMSRKDKTIKNEGTKRNPKWKKLGKV
jgi:ATP-dependent DNA helicase RecG